MSEPIIRTLRKSDYPALIDVVRRMWYPEYDERTVWRARPARLPQNSTGNQSR